MSVELTRRHVIESLSALGILSTLPISAVRADDLTQLGATIDRAGLKRLADSLHSQMPVGLSDGIAGQSLDAIKEAVGKDFATGRTVTVRDWQISHTEAHLILLMASQT